VTPMLHTTLRKRAADDGGASAVEFALVAPIFIVVLIGITVYGLYFGTAISVSQVAAEAARASVAGLDDSERSSLAVSKAETIVASHGLLTSSHLTVTAKANAGDPEVFDVEVTYDASNLPIYAFDGLLPVPPKVIARSASIQRGGF
jgi:Flp pilus assembly protein TadG